MSSTEFIDHNGYYKSNRNEDQYPYQRKKTVFMTKIDRPA